MKYICSVEDTTYFHWQIEVMLSNFKRVGIPPKDCHVILSFDHRPSRNATTLQRKYEANFHFYQKPRETNHYIASVKPFGMMMFFDEFPEMERERIFYHDADIIFTHLPTFPNKGSYMSECLQMGGQSYVDLDYLSQFEGVIEGLEKITGIKPRKEGGGAQYILENTTKDYWEKVYNDCLLIFEFLSKWNRNRPKGTRDVQSWCAEMWATLWNYWSIGEISIHESLDMCLSRDPIESLKPIIHNAGQMQSDNFDKGNYRTSYPPVNLKVNQDYCNAVYYDELKKTSYIRVELKDFDMIKIVKEGSQFKVGETVDLGKERNENAVKSGFAVWMEKKEAKPKRTKPSK